MERVFWSTFSQYCLFQFLSQNFWLVSAFYLGEGKVCTVYMFTWLSKAFNCVSCNRNRMKFSEPHSNKGCRLFPLLLCFSVSMMRFLVGLSGMQKVRGPTEIWTRIAGFKVQSANHYTMGPHQRPALSHLAQRVNQVLSYMYCLLSRSEVSQLRPSDLPADSRPGGATVARLTPDQKVACSNHVRVSDILTFSI